MSQQGLIRSPTGAVTGFRREILITTCEQLADRPTLEVLGLVRGNAVRARHVGIDILAGFRNLIGGEIRDYTQLLGQSREQSLDRMAEQARQLGANAIVGVRFTTSMVMGGAAEMLAYGTAVRAGQPRGTGAAEGA